MKEERECTVEAGKAVKVEVLEGWRARDVPWRALVTMSSGEGMSKAKGPRGASGMSFATATEDLCLGEEAFTLAVDSSSGDVGFVRPRL